MFRKLFPKAVLVVAGTIVLGAIGAGLWDAILKPILPWLATVCLNVATLGLRSVRDGLYAEIAQGEQDRAGLLVLLLVTGLTAGAMIGTVSGGRITRKIFGDATDRQASDGAVKKLRRVMLPLIGLFSGFLVVEGQAVAYVLSTRAMLDQYQTIVAPYITEGERLQLASQVAQMKSRADCEKVIESMSVVARAHKLTIPKFLLF